MPATSRILALCALVLLVPGCAAISTLTQSSRPLEIFELRTPDLPPVGSAGRGVEVVIEEPATGGTLATDRIMIRPGPLQAQYLPGARWADPAPAMLQTLILRSVLESGAVGSAGRRSVGGAADYAVLSELTDFQAEIAPDSRSGDDPARPDRPAGARGRCRGRRPPHLLGHPTGHRVTDRAGRRRLRPRHPAAPGRGRALDPGRHPARRPARRHVIPGGAAPFGRAASQASAGRRPGGRFVAPAASARRSPGNIR